MILTMTHFFLVMTTLFWLVAMIITAYNFLTADRLHRYSRPPLQASRESLSILVPVRNERENLKHNLPALLHSAHLLAQQNLSVELILLDDASTDGSDRTIESTLQEYIQSNPQTKLTVKFHRSERAPAPGWTGKNSACHQLQALAKNSVLLFMDADVNLGPETLQKAWSAFQSQACDSLTALPYQEMQTTMERLITPLIMHLSIFTLLPLRQVLKSPFPSLSVLNGQFYIIRRTLYDKIGGHEAIRSEVLEDVAIGRRIKAAPGTLHVVVAPSDISVRMYTTTRALWEGFGKNLAPLLGGNHNALALINGLLFSALLVLPYGLPLLQAPTPIEVLRWVPLAALGFCRILTAISFRYPWPLLELVIHPLATAAFFTLAVSSAYRNARRTTTWKGRKLP
jgi:chlorobactene glucosyltransferase